MDRNSVLYSLIPVRNWGTFMGTEKQLPLVGEKINHGLNIMFRTTHWSRFVWTEQLRLKPLKFPPIKLWLRDECENELNSEQRLNYSISRIYRGIRNFLVINRLPHKPSVNNLFVNKEVRGADLWSWNLPMCLPPLWVIAQRLTRPPFKTDNRDLINDGGVPYRFQVLSREPHG